MSAIIRKPAEFYDVSGELRVWNLPWEAVREFEIRNVPPRVIRGRHAHQTCKQLIQSSAGSFVVTLKTNSVDSEVIQVHPGIAVEVNPMHWIELSEFSSDAVVTVLCSEPYTPPIADFDEFLREVANGSV